QVPPLLEVERLDRSAVDLREPDADERLHPGLDARVQVPVEEREGLGVHRAAAGRRQTEVGGQRRGQGEEVLRRTTHGRRVWHRRGGGGAAGGQSSVLKVS